MPSMIIFCKDCQAKKQEIEENGVLTVINCKRLADQEHLPKDQQQCEIIWQYQA